MPPPAPSRASVPPEVSDSTLDALAREVLDLERTSPLVRGPKDRAIRERLGLSPTRYRQVLMRTIELPAALAYDPALVRRLRRLRDARREARQGAGQLGLPGPHG